MSVFKLINAKNMPLSSNRLLHSQIALRNLASLRISIHNALSLSTGRIHTPLLRRESSTLSNNYTYRPKPNSYACQFSTSTTTTTRKQMSNTTEKQAELALKVQEQGARIRQLKAEHGNKAPQLQAELVTLQELKAELSALESALSTPKFDRASLEELLRKRFFYSPSFGIYGGVSGLFDYGPPGSALQTNIIDMWRKHFVLEEDMLELDCSILTPHDVLLTSGHVERFSDLMCKDLKTGEIFRVDHLVEAELERRLEDDKLARENKKVKGRELFKLSEADRDEYLRVLAQIDNFGAEGLSKLIQDHAIKSPVGNELSPPEIFNLMFGTNIGPTGQIKGYLRPETAQGQFLNFKKLLEFNNEKMPFASALIGRSFRNEISPRSGLLRVREFTMAEIEHFVHPDHKDHSRFVEVSNESLNLLTAAIQMAGKSEPVLTKIGDAVSTGLVNNETLGYFMARIHLFLTKIGIKPEKLRFRQHLRNEMAHYACDCWDAEILTSYGWVECVGCADRSAYDLTRHSERTKVPLVAREKLKEPVTVEKNVLTINKSLFGPAFKKDAKLVEKALTTMTDSQLADFEKSFSDGVKSTTIKAEDGKQYTILREMVTIARESETIHVREYTPNVIEPSFGIGRILYSLLEHIWWIREGDENRHVLSFPACIAPIKCLI
eukprot:Partr_v1_DN28759_c0_g1_i5_m63285 putative Glycyl-trna synthetase